MNSTRNEKSAPADMNVTATLNVIPYEWRRRDAFDALRGVVGGAPPSAGAVRVLALPEPAGYGGAGQIAYARSALDPFDCVVLLGSTARPELEESVRSSEAWLAPIADLSGSRLPYADYEGRSATERGILEAVMALKPLLTCIGALPPGIVESRELSLLARLATRDVALTAAYAPNAPAGVQHPEAGLIPDAANLALNLAQEGYLRSSFFDRLHLCPHCRSSRLSVREECSRCRSPQLAEEAIVHHFRCAEQLPESRFRRGRDLQCPKCARALTHFGMDYDKPGSVQVCGSCGHFSDAPKVGFVCLDCGAHTDAEEMPNRDWHHYELTPLGRQSVHAGRLLGRSVQAPASQASAGSDGVEALPSQMVSPATLAEMLNLLEGVRQRSGRASTALELALATVPNGEKPRSRLESLTAKAVGELASEMLRPGDVMSTCPSGLLVLCPETKPREAEKLARRVGDHLRRNLTQDVVQGVRIMSSGDARELLPGGP